MLRYIAQLLLGFTLNLLMILKLSSRWVDCFKRFLKNSNFVGEVVSHLPKLSGTFGKNDGHLPASNAELCLMTQVSNLHLRGSFYVTFKRIRSNLAERTPLIIRVFGSIWKYRMQRLGCRTCTVRAVDANVERRRQELYGGLGACSLGNF